VGNHAIEGSVLETSDEVGSSDGGEVLSLIEHAFTHDVGARNGAASSSINDCSIQISVPLNQREGEIENTTRGNDSSQKDGGIQLLEDEARSGTRGEIFEGELLDIFEMVTSAVDISASDCSDQSSFVLAVDQKAVDLTGNRDELDDNRFFIFIIEGSTGDPHKEPRSSGGAGPNTLGDFVLPELTVGVGDLGGERVVQ